MKSPHKNIVLRAMFSPKMKVSSKSGNILVLFRKENFKTLPVFKKECCEMLVSERKSH